MWATPTTMDTLPPKSAEALEREATVSRPGRSKPANLRDQVSNVDNWPTPTVNGNHNRKGASATSGDGLSTAVMAAGQSWPTPCSTDHKGAGKTGKLRDRLDYVVERGGGKGDDKNWPSPRTRGLCGGSGHKQMIVDKIGREEGTEMFNGGSLNPDWVELLMGWPLGWSNLTPINPKDMDIWLSHVDNPWEGQWERNIPRVTTVKEQRVDRLKAIGNGQVPMAATTAFLILSQRLEDGV